MWPARRRSVTKEQAKELAREQIERRGLPFEEPVIVTARWRHLDVWTRADQLGGNVSVSVDRRTGEVSEPTVAPR